MSHSGDFNFDDFDMPKAQTNMQDILEKDDKFSIDWQKFDNPNNNQQSKSHSAISDIFNKSKKSQSQLSEKKDAQDSRDILQISIIASQGHQQGSFRFQKPDERSFPKNDQRFSRLQQLLQTAKKNSLQQFYKNIDQQNKAYVQQPQKFRSYNQFKDYIKELKMQKRKNQQKIPEKQMPNPFSSINSNKIYQSSNFNSKNMNAYPQNLQQSQNQPKKQQKPQYNFGKKQTNQNLFSSNNFLPNQFASQNFFQFQQSAKESKPSPIQKFNNFYQQKKPSLPEKAPQHNKDQDAFNFFDSRQKKQNDKKKQQMKKSLQPIRQQRHNSFQRTFQEQKLDDLFKNYQNMRKNFQQLMCQFKTTNQGQQKIVTQLRKLKDQKYQNQLRQSRKQRKQKRQKDIQQKNKKLDNIKEQINKIKTTDKDILYSQINKKIQQLQSVVRTALQQINQQKQNKLMPTITNYYCEHQKFNQKLDIDRQFEEEFNRQRYNEKQHEGQKSISNRQQQNSQEIFTQSLKNPRNQSNKQMMYKSPGSRDPLPRQKPNQKKSKQSNVRSSEPRLKSPIQNSAKSRSNYSSRVKQNTVNMQNLFSPLDLHLHADTNFYQQEVYYEDFSPQQFSQQHIPRQYQVNTKTFRNCLTQKSSVVFQSFDFHISARFSIVDDQLHPIVAALRVGNKCSIDLYDVHAIIYGPLGPGISTDPSTVFQQQVKKNSSFAFQVSVDKSCLQDNGFSIQLSYKTDSMSKKKINFKIPLPLVQLIRPEFIYEQKFTNDWNCLTNQIHIKPKRLDYTYLRSHEDLKLILPFIELNEQNADIFSYGIMFRYPKCDNIFYLKVTCYVSGKASIQLRTQKPGDKKIKQQILNVLNFILYSPM